MNARWARHGRSTEMIRPSRPLSPFLSSPPPLALSLSLLLIVLPITTLRVNMDWPQSRSNILLEMNCYYWFYWRFDWFLIWLCCFVISDHILFSLSRARWLPLKSKDQSIRYCTVKIARRTDTHRPCWREKSLARHSETAGSICVCVCVFDHKLFPVIIFDMEWNIQGKTGREESYLLHVPLLMRHECMSDLWTPPTIVFATSRASAASRIEILPGIPNTAHALTHRDKEKRMGMSVCLFACLLVSKDVFRHVHVTHVRVYVGHSLKICFRVIIFKREYD